MNGLVPGWLVRGGTYPLHERICRRRTLAEARSLEWLAAQPATYVDKACRERLRELLAFAEQRLPYFSDLMRRHRLAPKGDDPLGELRKLPLLNKAHIRANAADLVWRDVPGGPIPHSSGGTTGDTLRFFIDRTRQAQTLAARTFAQRRFGIRVGDRRVYLWGSPIESRRAWLKRWRDRLLNEVLIDAFEMSDAQMDEHLRTLRAFRPRLIYAYPSALALLARRALRRCSSAALRRLRTDLAVLTGEEVTAEQREQVAAAFGCRVISEYGSRETGLIAHECPRGRMHVFSPFIHVDVTAPDGTPLPAGRDGEVICTTLTTRAQPMIRYRVGDAGRLDGELCPCGLPFPTLTLLGGKITGFIALPNGRLCHGAVTSHVLRNETGVVEFKTFQHALDRFEVLLVVDERFDVGTLDRVRGRYRDLFGAQIRVTPRIVERIPPDPSGKRRYVVSNVAPDLANFEVLADAST